MFISNRFWAWDWASFLMYWIRQDFNGLLGTFGEMWISCSRLCVFISLFIAIDAIVARNSHYFEFPVAAWGNEVVNEINNWLDEGLARLSLRVDNWLCSILSICIDSACQMLILGGLPLAKRSLNGCEFGRVNVVVDLITQVLVSSLVDGCIHAAALIFPFISDPSV